MKKEVPVKEQIIRIVENNPDSERLDHLMSGCFCEQYTTYFVKCEDCKIRFKCYTSVRVKRNAV